ncbi:TonB-dependent heme/hemoglobin receptor family protein precursor [Devosia sp. LC5]|uniref:TonB-dependent receptor domain-containing protein n=1 Tax=Devosia sp. LC5 TaxID=1502724 RepID=UPI0004E3DE5C|nr:TonB-dependent receptor [Devosia sp. LC5]KFC67661.1 TonB-dependent heme/hemoglobin receptor family protein precursor [Devosia sp. LC5]
MGLVRSHAAALMCGAALSVVGMGAAFAQSTTTNASNITMLERLVIGAGAPKIAIDTPQAVTVVNQADIDATQATSIGEVLSTVPGVTIIGSDRIFGESFNIRGIGTAETSGDEARIIVNVDGAKKFYEQYRMGSFFSDPELYKQVEVLRGPASSTLYGSGALGGVINFTTKDASDFITEGHTGAARLKTQYSSNGDGTLLSGIVAQQVNESFDILAAGNWRRSEEYDLANGNTLSGSDFDALSGLIKGTARFGENDEQVLRLSYQRWSSDAENQDYAQTGTVAQFGLVDREVVDQTAVLSYENADSDNPWVDLKANVSFSDTYVTQSGSSIGPIGDAEYGYRTWQANIQNTSEFDTGDWVHFLTYGLQGSYQDRTAFTTLPVPNPAITTHPEGQDTRLGVFVQNEAIYDDRLTIIAGGRADFVWQTPEQTSKGERNIEDVALSPKIAALYEFNDNFSVFGSVAHTQRLPTLDELYQYNATKVPSLGLEKESSNNFEAGFALSGYELIQEGDQASVKVTGFYSALTNMIESSPSVAGNPYFRNIGEATIYGMEVEGAYESERLFGRVAYTATVGEDDQTGEALTSIPAHKLVVTLGGREPEYGIEYGAKATFAASADTGVTPSAGGSAATPGYITVDLFTSWKPTTGPLEGAEVRFGIDNIFNADYRDNQTPDRSLGRTFKVTLAKQFDW